MIAVSGVSPFVLALIYFCALGLRPACAGAFLLEPGKWKVIATTRASTSSARYDERGRLVAEKRYGKTESATLIEYGYDRDVTLLLSPAFRSLRAQGPPEQRAVSIGSLDLGARWRILSADAQILSFQVLTRLPARSDPVFWLENRAKTELRLGYGRSDLFLRGRGAFVDTGLSWAKRAEPWRDEVHIDLTFGWKTWADRLALIQWNYSLWPGAQGQMRAPRQLKLEASSVQNLGAGWSFQVGSFVSRGGVATRYERGSIIGLWRAF
jgi:hypothetical protein